jgi:hypothetical protein
VREEGGERRHKEDGQDRARRTGAITRVHPTMLHWEELGECRGTAINDAAAATQAGRRAPRAHARRHLRAPRRTYHGAWCLRCKLQSTVGARRWDGRGSLKRASVSTHLSADFETPSHRHNDEHRKPHNTKRTDQDDNFTTRHTTQQERYRHDD